MDDWGGYLILGKLQDQPRGLGGLGGFMNFCPYHGMMNGKNDEMRKSLKYTPLDRPGRLTPWKKCENHHCFSAINQDKTVMLNFGDVH